MRISTRVFNFLARFSLSCLLFVALATKLHAQSAVVTGSTGANASYGTLKAAFTAINASSQTSNNILITVSGTLDEGANKDSLSSGAWSTLTIQPSGAATITGTGTPLIELNGSNNVIINGLNDGTNTLTIANTSSAITAETYAIRFVNNASNNLITNCTITSQYTSTITNNGGCIGFRTATTGNNNNKISFCKFTTNGTTLSKCIHGAGTATSAVTENKFDTITNCEFYDYFNPAAPHAGVYMSGGNQSWVITNNKFYQTATRTMTTTATTYGIFAVNTANTAGGLVITGNTIGYSSANRTGTFTYTGASSATWTFAGIQMQFSTTATVPCYLSNNLVSDIAYTGAATSSSFTGILNANNTATADSLTLNADTVRNIAFGGSTTGGVIGISSGAATPIAVTNCVVDNISRTAVTTGLTYGIQIGLSTNARISNNTVHNMSLGSTYTTGNFVGIFQNSSATVVTYANNTVFNMNAAGTAGPTNFTGIYDGSGSGIKIFRNNTVDSLFHAGSANPMSGIFKAASGSSDSIVGNTITRLWSSGGASIRGISVTSSTTMTNIYNNNIKNINANGAVDGIYVLPSSGTHNVRVVLNTVDSLATTGGAAATSGLQISGGGTLTGTYWVDSNIVRNMYCTGASNPFLFAVRVANMATVYSIGNTIYNISNTASSGTGATYGLSMLGGGTNYYTARNKIYNISSTQSAGGVAGGMFINAGSAAGTNYYVYDNIISDISAPFSTINNATIGIGCTATIVANKVNIYNNTVYLTASNSNATPTSSCVTMSVQPTLTLRNNILVNLSSVGTSGYAVAFSRNSSSLTNYSANSNNNLFYAGTPDAQHLIYKDTSDAATANMDQTLAAFKTRVSTKDAASVTGNSTFVSTDNSNASFLKPLSTVYQVAESAGASLGTGAPNSNPWKVDFALNIRQDSSAYSGNGTNPDAGAYEINSPSTIVELSNNPNGQISAGGVQNNATDYILHQAQMLVGYSSATVSAVSFALTGSYTSTDITNFKLYYTTTNTFATTNLLGTATSGGAVETVNFSGLSAAFPVGTYYLWLTVDVSGTATLGHTIIVGAMSSSNMSVSTANGAISTSSSTSASGTITIANLCSGKPAGGTATAALSIVCPNATTALTLSGASNATGITYQWYSSNDNFVSDNVALGTASAQTSTASANASIAYRCVLTCTNSAMADTSSSVTVAVHQTSLNIEATVNSVSSNQYCGYNYKPIQLTATTGGATPNAISWTTLTTDLYTNNPATTAYTSGSNATVYATPTISRTYTAIADFSNLGCSNQSATQVVTVGNKVIADSVSVSGAVCAGSTPSITANVHLYTPFNAIKISEITQSSSNSNGKQASFPSYMTVAGTSSYNFVELSNLSTGSIDISGLVLQTWTGAALQKSYTIPSGTVMPSHSTTVIALSTMTSNNTSSSPAYFYAATAVSNTSTTGVGYIIRYNGVIVDAAASNGYTFPAGANVSNLQWAGSVATMSSTAGMRRTNAADNNTAGDWAIATALNLMRFGTYFSSFTDVTLSTISYAWSPATNLNVTTGNPVTFTMPNPASASTLKVIATETGGCTDTIIKTINPTTAPSGYTKLWSGVTGTDWSVAANWCDVSIPGSSDNVYIDTSSSKVIQPVLSVNSVANKLTIAAGASLNIGSGLGLSVGGDLARTGNITGAGTITLDGSTTQNLTGVGSLASNLTINKSAGNAVLGNHTTINGALTLNSGNLDINGDSLILNGTVSGGTNIIATATNSIVAINGPSSIPSNLGSTVYGLVINNGSGVSLSNNLTVTGSLNLKNGVVTTGSNILTVSSTGTFARTSGWVNGNLSRNIGVGNSISRTFDIGDATNYTPASLTFASVSAAGNIVASIATPANTGAHYGTQPLSTSTYVNRYWSFTNTGSLVFTTYDATLNYVAGDLIGATASSVKYGQYVSSWSTGAPSVGTNANTISAVSALADFILANCDVIYTPSVSISSTSTAVCTGSSVTFTATPTNGGNGPIYQWKKNGSNIGSGGTSLTLHDYEVTSGDIISCVLTANNACQTTAIANSNEIELSVGTVTPSVSITTASDTICSGSNTTFVATGNNGGSSPTYQWKRNGIDAGNGSSITFLSNTLNNGDVIYCVLAANNLCQTTATANSNYIQLTVNSSPAMSPITNSQGIVTTATMCTLGASVRYYDTTYGGTWSSSAAGVVSVTNKGIVTANSNGTAVIRFSKVSATSSCVSTSIVTITVAQATSPSAITGTNQVCVNSTVNLANTTNGGIWSSFNNRGVINVGGIFTGKNAGAGEVRYTVTNASGCTAYSSLPITVNPIPNVPTINYASGTVNPQVGATSGGYCVGKVFTVVGSPNVPAGVWSSTGIASITSGGVVTINAVGAGTIKYTYTSAAGCVNSRTINGNGYSCVARGVVTSNEPLISNNDFTMYPNPSKGVINLNVETLVGTGSIVVTDLYGKTVKNQGLSMGSNTVNISNLSKGFYLVSVITSEGKNTKKLIVE